MNLPTESWAEFDQQRIYRYMLLRKWNNHGLVAIIGLNPSTADEYEDDPTIRRCRGFAQQWGYGGIVMLNLFGFRATDPGQLKKTVDPIGPENDLYIKSWVAASDIIVAAWGAYGSIHGRDDAVKEILRSSGRSVQCLGRTKQGHPRHPLYMPRSTPLERFL